MIVRLTFLSILPQNIVQAKRVFEEEIVPVIKRQRGNIDCRLLEPIEKNEDYISMTTWETKADADAYNSSGIYRELVEKVRKHLAKDPSLKVYTTESILAHA